MSLEGLPVWGGAAKKDDYIKICGLWIGTKGLSSEERETLEHKILEIAKETTEISEEVPKEGRAKGMLYEELNGNYYFFKGLGNSEENSHYLRYNKLFVKIENYDDRIYISLEKKVKDKEEKIEHIKAELEKEGLVYNRKAPDEYLVLNIPPSKKKKKPEPMIIQPEKFVEEPETEALEGETPVEEPREEEVKKKRKSWPKIAGLSTAAIILGAGVYWYQDVSQRVDLNSLELIATEGNYILAVHDQDTVLVSSKGKLLDPKGLQLTDDELKKYLVANPEKVEYNKKEVFEKLFFAEDSAKYVSIKGKSFFENLEFFMPVKKGKIELIPQNDLQILYLRSGQELTIYGSLLDISSWWENREKRVKGKRQLEKVIGKFDIDFIKVGNKYY